MASWEITRSFCTSLGFQRVGCIFHGISLMPSFRTAQWAESVVVLFPRDIGWRGPGILFCSHFPPNQSKSSLAQSFPGFIFLLPFTLLLLLSSQEWNDAKSLYKSTNFTKNCSGSLNIKTDMWCIWALLQYILFCCFFFYQARREISATIPCRWTKRTSINTLTNLSWKITTISAPHYL